jgi:hypothetical protein
MCKWRYISQKFYIYHETTLKFFKWILIETKHRLNERYTGLFGKLAVLSRDCWRVLDRCSCLLDTLVQHVTTFYISLFRSHSSVHSRIFISCFLAAAFSGGHPPHSGFPNGLRPQLPASHSILWSCHSSCGRSITRKRLVETVIYWGH